MLKVCIEQKRNTGLKPFWLKKEIHKEYGFKNVSLKKKICTKIFVRCLKYRGGEIWPQQISGKKKLKMLLTNF